MQTLLNSGNAIFESTTGSATAHAHRIEAALVEKLGIDAHVIVKSAADLAAIRAENELAAVATDPSRLLVAFTAHSRPICKASRCLRH